MTVEKRLVTAEDLLCLPTDMRCELLDGEVVELSPAGGRHNDVMGVLTALLWTYVKTARLGKVLPGDTGIILRRNPDRVRAPDICFIAQDRLPADGVPEGFLEIVPDLIVEIVSPSDRARDVQQKTDEWLRAGARLVWTIYPETRTVVAQTATGTQSYREHDTLTAVPVLPDFTVPVAMLFT